MRRILDALKPANGDCIWLNKTVLIFGLIPLSDFGSMLAFFFSANDGEDVLVIVYSKKIVSFINEVKQTVKQVLAREVGLHVGK